MCSDITQLWEMVSVFSFFKKKKSVEIDISKLVLKLNYVKLSFHSSFLSVTNDSLL